MVNHELLQEYSESVKRLRNQCGDIGISEEEFRSLYFDSLKSLENYDRLEIPRRLSHRKYKVILLCVVLLGCVAYNFKTIYSSLICNLQEYIYPGLKLLRRLAIPFVSVFPALTEWYHETCLIPNPFFSVVDMDCWPCSGVSNVREVYDPKPGYQQNAPFIYETNQPVLTFNSIWQLYMTNKHLFNSFAPNIMVNNKYYTSPEEVFDQQHIADKNYYIWRFNNMNIARVLRQMIPRPKVVPKFGQSTERFLIVDSSQQLFQIPDTECSFSFLLCLSGNRVIDLVPAEECSHQCKTLKVELKETYLLWYNWWYWRPKAQPSNGNSTFIAHVGSYC